MFRKSLISVLAIVGTSLTLNANAAPIIGIDMDPGTPGIQSFLSVVEGTSLTFDLVAFDDGTGITPILVDTVNVDLDISSPGLVSFGGATVGAFAASMVASYDVFTGAPVGPGSALIPAPFPGPGSIGLHGYTIFEPFPPFAFGLPTSLSIGGPSGPFDVLMSFSFDALTAGVTSFSPIGATPGSELLFAGAPSGGPLFPGLLPPGLLTIMSATPPPPGVPEPSTIALLALGLVGLMRKKIIR